MSKLFEPITIGVNTRPNRIFMAPMTRGRAEAGYVPGDLMKEYYSLRASAGLIISEAVAISPQAYGWPGSPGIWTDAQQQGWQEITDVVAKQGGAMFLQLWHTGRCSHPDYLGGELPLAPSAIAADGIAYTPEGKKPYVCPREMSVEDIAITIQDYVNAARRAMDAGFAGVELHGGGGYLVDEFIRDGSNHRTDQYGGTLDNRLRFLRETIEALCHALGEQHVALRLAPKVSYNDMHDSDPCTTYGRAAEMLNDFDLAFIDIIEGLPDKSFVAEPGPPVTPVIRREYKGVLVANGGYDRELGEQSLHNGEADAIAYGIPFIANPDLLERWRLDAPLQTSDPENWYVGGPKGYTDFPLFDGDMSAANIHEQSQIKPNEL